MALVFISFLIIEITSSSCSTAAALAWTFADIISMVFNAASTMVRIILGCAIFGSCLGGFPPVHVPPAVFSAVLIGVSITVIEPLVADIFEHVVLRWLVAEFGGIAVAFFSAEFAQRNWVFIVLDALRVLFEVESC